MPPGPKKPTERLTDAQVKSALSAKGGLQGQDAHQADLVVQALCEALPDRRGTECNRLRNLINDPGGKAIVWDQLVRRREDYGPKAGLVAIIEMLGANENQFVQMGQEPGSSVLASMCTQNSRALELSKEKFVMRRLMGIIADHKASEGARKNTSWILRRVCEVSNKMRMELGGDRVSLQTLGKIMRCEPLHEPSFHDDQRSTTRSRPPSRSSAAPSRTLSSEWRNQNQRSGSDENEFDKSFTQINSMTERGGIGNFSSLPPSPSKAPLSPLQRKAAAPFPNAAQGNSGATQKRQTQFQDINGSFHSMASANRASSGANNNNNSNRPQTAETGTGYFRGISRPGTGMGTTMLRDNDSMCVQGNVCCTIGNLCFSDDVIDRLGKTEGVISGLLYMVEYGTEWSSGHAARAIGNMAYSPENCKTIIDKDPSNIAARSLFEMVSSPATSVRTKELAIFALANLTRRADICTRLGGVPGIYATLNNLAAEGINREDVDRTICNMSQSRLGTRTWRQPKRI